MDVANVHHHLAVAVPKTFHTPRPMSYWNETSEMSAVLYLPPPPVTPCGCTTHAPCWGLYKAQLVDQPGRNAQSMRHLPHTETLCSPTTNPDAFSGQFLGTVQLRKHTGVGFAAASSPSRPLYEHAPEVWRTRAERELESSDSPLAQGTSKRKYENGARCGANARAIGSRPQGLLTTPPPIASTCWRGRSCRTKRGRLASCCLHTALLNGPLPGGVDVLS